ncbi:MAG: DUF86 domain-containing protein [Defluviitaleaceae bacterium]|nr:DUF86 domain-containing protein [Defluviitaleaceae bacterium]
MKEKDKVIIKKMISYSDDIEGYVDGLHFSGFEENSVIHRACALTILQIGELSKRLSEDLKEEYSQVPWKDMRDARNFLAHEYESLKMNLLWMVVKESVPKLKEQLINILKD